MPSQEARVKSRVPLSVRPKVWFSSVMGEDVRERTSFPTSPNTWPPLYVMT